jgi:hypothetical protein
MSARHAATSGALLLALCAGGATAQTIEITSPSIGTVKVRPEPISKARTQQGAVRTAPASAGVDFGLRRNRDGSLYDALDPRQNPAAASALDNGAAPVANVANNVQTNAQVPAGNANNADFPYGINGER